MNASKSKFKDTNPRSVSRRPNLRSSNQRAKIIVSSPKNIEKHFNDDDLFNHAKQKTIHKCYGSRKRQHSNPFESFSLPDQTILKNSPVFLETEKKSVIDTESGNPVDYCVINLNNVNQPWLVEYPEVITPYWDVESLLQFDIEDIRHKIEPDNIEEIRDSFDFDRKDQTNVLFTSTPLKNENNVDLCVLKDQVLKALEEVIKEKNGKTKIDMKIEIVPHKNKNSFNDKLEIKINDSIETESCQSTSSSKENYFVTPNNHRHLRSSKVSLNNSEEQKNYLNNSEVLPRKKGRPKKYPKIENNEESIESQKRITRSSLPNMEHNYSSIKLVDKKLKRRSFPCEFLHEEEQSSFQRQLRSRNSKDLISPNKQNSNSINIDCHNKGNGILTTLKKNNLDLMVDFETSSKTSFYLNTSIDSVPKNIERPNGLRQPNYCEDLDDLPLLFRQDNDDEEDEKKIEEKCLIDNGIQNKVKIVLNPLNYINNEKSEKELSPMPIESPLIRKSLRGLNKTFEIEPEIKPSKIQSEILEPTHFKLPEIKDEILKPEIQNNIVELPEIKNEIIAKIEKNIVYKLGDFVWAQVSKYPYWPAVICNDPITETFFDERQLKNKHPYNLYHIRFFGDYGRRSWVGKRHLMLYSSKNDLEMIANKLKAENKTYNVVKEYLVKGHYKLIEKWNRAIEELESLRHKTYGDILKYLIDSYETYKNNRKEKRKSHILEASSESESEEPEEKLRRKRFKSSNDNNLSQGFDEINIPTTMTQETILNKSVEDQGMLEQDQKLNSPVSIRPRRSLNSIKRYGITELQNISFENNIKTEISEVKQNIEAETESKASSNSTTINPNLFTFEYQVELHKRNHLFHGLRSVRVCDFCFKTGDLYKCKGRCGGNFHLDCAFKVTERRDLPKPKKRENNKNKKLLSPKFRRSEDSRQTRSQTQCQIVTIKSKHVIDTSIRDNLPENFHEMSITEQIDYGMKEMMSKFDPNCTTYQDSTDSSSDEGSTTNKKVDLLESPCPTPTDVTLEDDVEGEEKSSDDLEVSMISKNASSNSIQHVTADSIILTEINTPMDMTNMKCSYCRLEKDPPCYSCGLEVSKRGDAVRQKCCQQRCGRYYHLSCLKSWPQTQWSIVKWSKNQQPEDLFTCPAHTCHTCFSEELGANVSCRVPGDKLARCLLCPSAFHTTTFCIPAGSEILGGSQILCPRHRKRPIQPINTVWCFICSEGGNLVCCDTCPTSVHPECQPINYTDDDKYICEDCESGRFPLYDEIVWVKLGQYRWWPAIVLFPNEVPDNVNAIKRHRGDFAVRFFGTNDYYWINKARAFLFQEGDQGGSPGETNKSKNKVYELFAKAIEDAAIAYKLKKEFKLRREAESISTLKPPPYIKINKNKPVGNVKGAEMDLSNGTPCECDPDMFEPCGPDSNCINRLLLTECDPYVCPAKERCRNQSFQKRDYPPMVPHKTQGRGWGLKTLAPIHKGQFIIEYVGELIDTEEYQRRIRKMHEKKEDNYYFMTMDGDRMIDAGPKGNLSRFMNHCCDPNCVTQKWTVKGDTRVGLFAKCDIEADAELTFNYNLEVVGQEKKVCRCGASNCSGFIGVKAKQDNANLTPTEQRKPKKNVKKPKPVVINLPSVPPCFICGKIKSDIMCNNKSCYKGYHLDCLNLTMMPEVSKFICPRHKCNICSNRTIRCCVKCTNSFCPSHSEGNVRHDKLLGFVCHLHDPGVSLIEDSSSIEIISKQNPKHFELNHFTTITRDLVRSAWQKQTKRLVKIPPNNIIFSKRKKSLSEDKREIIRLTLREFSKEHSMKKKALKNLQSNSQTFNIEVAPYSFMDEKSKFESCKPERSRRSKSDSIIIDDLTVPTIVFEDEKSQIVDDQESLDDEDVSLDKRLEKMLCSNKKTKKRIRNSVSHCQ